MILRPQAAHSLLLLALSSLVPIASCWQQPILQQSHTAPPSTSALHGWIQDNRSGEWGWQEDDPNYVKPSPYGSNTATLTVNEETGEEVLAGGAPKLPSGKFKPKQSLGQNFLQDQNTIHKIIKAFDRDRSSWPGFTHEGVTDGDDADSDVDVEHRKNAPVIELGPGAGALTDVLYEKYAQNLRCIEIDDRSVDLLNEKFPDLDVRHEDVMQTSYPELSRDSLINNGSGEAVPLCIIGNLPYYITSQILFALADASHVEDCVHSATVTMQYEVAMRIVAKTCTKDYGILSVVFQLYAEPNFHFKIPPTVFYPQPKVDSALIGLHFVGPKELRKRYNGVQPIQLQRVLKTTFQQRRKTVGKTLKRLMKELYSTDAEEDDVLAITPPILADAETELLPENWMKKRPEELSALQFVEMTRIVFSGFPTTVSPDEMPLGHKVWRKEKHGANL